MIYKKIERTQMVIDHVILVSDDEYEKFVNILREGFGEQYIRARRAQMELGNPVVLSMRLEDHSTGYSMNLQIRKIGENEK